MPGNEPRSIRVSSPVELLVFRLNLHDFMASVGHLLGVLSAAHPTHASGASLGRSCCFYDIMNARSAAGATWAARARSVDPMTS
jgi:hypothetical protein